MAHKSEVFQLPHLYCITTLPSKTNTTANIAILDNSFKRSMKRCFFWTSFWMASAPWSCCQEWRRTHIEHFNSAWAAAHHFSTIER